MTDHALEQHVRRLKQPVGIEAQNALWAAVQYALLRIQHDPDMRHYCGQGTQTFAMLCEAEAAVTGEAVDAVRERRSEPKVSGKPEVDRLIERVEQLERDLGEVGYDQCGECDTHIIAAELAETMRGDAPFCSRCGEADRTAGVGETCMKCFAGVMLAPEAMVLTGRAAAGLRVE